MTFFQTTPIHLLVRVLPENEEAAMRAFAELGAMPESRAERSVYLGPCCESCDGPGYGYQEMIFFLIPRTVTQRQVSEAFARQGFGRLTR